MGIFGCTSTSPGSANPSDSQVLLAEPSNDQAKVLTAFGEKLFTEVEADPEKVNAVISPMSLFFALGLAGEGAAGATQEAFQQAIGLDKEQTRRIAAYLVKEISNLGQGTTVNIANSTWLDESLKLDPDYTPLVKAYYAAEVFNQDLQASGAVDQINGWVNGKTNGLIPTILDDLSPDEVASMVAVLVDAIYLKAEWAAKFDPEMTSVGRFSLSGGSPVEAEFLAAKAMEQRYFDVGDSHGVLLPYKDGRLAFLAVTAKEGTDLPKLAGDSINSWITAAAPTPNVKVVMPKFKTTFKKDLKNDLIALGLGNAFDPDAADFSELGTSSTGENLAITNVLHKVDIAVGEEGTEAAAATAVIMAPTSAQVEETPVVFDHPYRYAVVDTQTGIPLFLGAINDPSLAPFPS
jgi:serpin B